VKRRKPQLDALDAESIKELQQSRGWKIYQFRLERLRAAKITALVSQQAEIETATIRGFVQGINTALSIPFILISESKGGTTE
jgi:hypothetical protein